MKLFIRICILLVIYITSCNRKDTGTTQSVSYEKGNHILEIRMPKKIKSLDTIWGKLVFDMELDSALNSRIIERHLFLFLTNDSLDTISAKKIKKVNHRTFKDVNLDGMIDWYLMPMKTEVQDLTFVIEDNLLLKPLDTNYSIDLTTFEYSRSMKLGVKK